MLKTDKLGLLIVLPSFVGDIISSFIISVPDLAPDRKEPPDNIFFFFLKKKKNQ